MKKVKIPRPLSLVKVLGVHRAIATGDKGVFLGEIPNMPGHCVVYLIASERIIYAYHTSDFAELTESEV